MAAPGGLAFLRLRQGRPGRYPRPEDAAAYQYTPTEREAIKAWTSSHVVGTPDAVVEGLHELVERTGVQELMISTMLASPGDRERSVTLLAEAARLTSATTTAEAAAGAGPG